jgi:hypothetical protein
VNDELQGKSKFKISRDSLFKFHFSILDSVVDSRKMDSSFTCCTSSIEFMELSTGIDGQKDGTTLGKLAFTRRDLAHWHEWYSNVKFENEK